MVMFAGWEELFLRILEADFTGRYKSAYSLAARQGCRVRMSKNSFRSPITFYLLRTLITDQCTIGWLVVGGTVFRTMERPWKNNESNVSCIPSGVYPVDSLPQSSSGKYHNVFHVKDVPDRTGILIHNGNLVSHSKGCIILGLRKGYIGGEPAVLASRIAINKLNSIIKGGSFNLEIL